MAEIELSDIQASTDVLAQLYNEADGFDVEKSITYLNAVLALEVQVKAAKSELEARALRLLEQPILVGNRAYSKKLVVKQRPIHDKITARVMRVAATSDASTGEVLSAAQAAENATKLMTQLFVAPSTLPKAGGLKAIGLTFDEVTRADDSGGTYELKVTELE